MKDNIHEAARALGKRGAAKVKAKYGDAHYLKLNRAMHAKLRATLSPEHRKQRAQLIRREIPFAQLTPDQYGNAIAEHDKRKAAERLRRVQESESSGLHDV